VSVITGNRQAITETLFPAATFFRYSAVRLHVFGARTTPPEPNFRDCALAGYAMHKTY
jgi:hypothetical protein